MRVHKHKVVMVDWVDSSGSAGWRSPEEVEEISLKVQSVGILIASYKHQIVISHSVDLNAGSVYGTFSIPRCAIKRLRYL